MSGRNAHLREAQQRAQRDGRGGDHLQQRPVQRFANLHATVSLKGQMTKVRGVQSPDAVFKLSREGFHLPALPFSTLPEIGSMLCQNTAAEV